MPSTEVTTGATGLTAHENMDVPRQIFPSAACLTRDTLEISFSPSGVPFISHQNLGDSNRYGKFYRGFCSQYISRKSHGSVQKIFKQFWCSGEKTGSGG